MILELEMTVGNQLQGIGIWMTFTFMAVKLTTVVASHLNKPHVHMGSLISSKGIINDL
jgi:hypothetical protein